MSMPSYQSFTTTGAKTSVSLDWARIDFSASYVVIVPAGTTATVAVEYTYDDVNDATITPVWISPTGYTAITATKEGELLTPRRAIRLNIAAITGGPVRFVVLQGLPQ